MNKLEGPFILVNPERCVGCHTCELACAAAHTAAGSIIGAVLAGERLHRRNRVVQVDSVKLSTQCRQCEDAPCVRICPTGATYRTETYTAVDQRLCIGCRLCMMVCPFGAIHVSTTDLAGREKVRLSSATCAWIGPAARPAWRPVPPRPSASSTPPRSSAKPPTPQPGNSWTHWKARSN